MTTPRKNSKLEARAREAAKANLKAGRWVSKLPTLPPAGKRKKAK